MERHGTAGPGTDARRFSVDADVVALRRVRTPRRRLRQGRLLQAGERPSLQLAAQLLGWSARSSIDWEARSSASDCHAALPRRAVLSESSQGDPSGALTRRTDARCMSELATTLFPARRALAPATAPDVEIVVPVYNEAAGLERSIRRLHRFLTDGFPFTWRIVIADNASVDATPEIAAKLALHAAAGQPSPPRPQGPRPRAARRLEGERRARRDLHGRRPLDRSARPAPARRAADVRSQRPRDRHAARARLAGRPRPEARVHLARLQPHPPHRPARPLQRRPVRLQGRPPRRAREPARRRQGRELVLRHRAAGARAAARAADPRGAGRLGRRPRLARGHRPHGDRRPQGRRAAARRRADRALHGDRRRQHARLRRPVPRCCGRCWAPAARTPPRSRSPRSPTPPPTAGSRSGSAGASTWSAITSAAASCSCSRSR